MQLEIGHEVIARSYFDEVLPKSMEWTLEPNTSKINKILEINNMPKNFHHVILRLG